MTDGTPRTRHYPGYALVARLPSRRREIYDALEDRPPWRRVALAIGRVGVIARALRRLDAPGIVRLIADHGDAIALSWVRGRRLDRAVGGLSGDERVELAIQLAELVAHAHDRGVVLRDIKPGNLLLEDGRLVLVDLDFAMCDDDAARGEHESGGTWGWSAPEQAVLRPAQIDRRADLYAIGTTLYFLFAGEPLFSRGAAAVREQFVEQRFERRVDRVPAAVAPILRTLLQLERSARTLSAAEVAAALRATRGEWVAVAPAPDPEPELPAWPGDDAMSQLVARLSAPRGRRSADDSAIAAAECARIGDATAAAAHARAALAIDPGHAGALAWLARVHLAAGDLDAAHGALDQLEALPGGIADDALEAALGLAVTLMRPECALALAQRSGRAGAFATLADHCGEWLERAGLLGWHERAARQARGHGADEASTVLALRGTALLALVRRGEGMHDAALAGCIAQLVASPATRGHGRALEILDQIRRGDGAGALDALHRAILDGTLGPASAGVLHRAPLTDGLGHGAAAIRLCEAILLALVGLDRDAAAVALPPLDAARLALATGRHDDARALVAAAPPSEIADQIRALAARDVDALGAVYRARPSWESAYWLCHALIAAGRAAECVAIVEAVWQREGPDDLLAELRAAGLAGLATDEPQPEPADEPGRSARESAARALARRDWDALYQAGAVALALDPDDAEARAQLALASLERGEAANALGFAKRAAAIDPDSELAWDLIILAERGVGGGDALATARASVRACPDSARLHSRLAEALTAAGDGDDALVASERAIRLGPRDRTAWAVHAGLLLDVERAVDALHVAASFEAACGPGYDVHAIRLRAELQRGEFERAVAAGLAGVAADAGQPILWRDLALAWLGLGKIADARNARAVITRCGAEDPALAFYLDLGDEATAWLAASRGPLLATHRDLDLGFAAAVARLATDVEAAVAALRTMCAEHRDYAPRHAARIALRGIAPLLAARIEVQLADQLVAAPRELGWAGALYFLARGRAAPAAALAARALDLVSDPALWLVAAEAAVRAGDDALTARAMTHTEDPPVARLARRLRCA